MVNWSIDDLRITKLFSCGWTSQAVNCSIVRGSNTQSRLWMFVANRSWLTWPGIRNLACRKYHNFFYIHDLNGLIVQFWRYVIWDSCGRCFQFPTFWLWQMVSYKLTTYKRRSWVKRHQHTFHFCRRCVSYNFIGLSNKSFWVLVTSYELQYYRNEHFGPFHFPLDPPILFLWSCDSRF